jgi:cell division protein FtsB
MAIRARSYTNPRPASTNSYSFWKDVSFFGCIISGILLGIVVFKLLSPESGIPKVREVLRIKKQLETEIEQLEVDNARIVEQIEAMQTDPFWQEKIAREELNMALPDEIIYKFTE